MKHNLTNTTAPALLRLAIRDNCRDYEPAASPEEAEAMITLGDLQENILKQLELTLSEEERKFVTPDFLKAELKRNKLKETRFTTEDGIQEVWLLKKKAEIY